MNKYLVIIGISVSMSFLISCSGDKNPDRPALVALMEQYLDALGMI